MKVIEIETDICEQQCCQRQPPRHAPGKINSRAKSQRVSGAEILRQHSRDAREREHDHERYRQCQLAFHKPRILRAAEMTSRGLHPTKSKWRMTKESRMTKSKIIPGACLAASVFGFRHCFVPALRDHLSFLLGSG